MSWMPEKEWEGQDAFLIGGGASLRGFDFHILEGCNTIGVNDAFRLGKDIVKICLFGDSSWFHKVKFDLQKFGGIVVCNAPSLQRLNVDWLKPMARKREGLHNPPHLGWNYSTGASAINLALQLGAKRVFLLGYDLCAIGQKTHWHDHRAAPTRQAVFDRFKRGFNSIADALPFWKAEVVHVFDGESQLPRFRHATMSEFKDYLTKYPSVMREKQDGVA